MIIDWQCLYHNSEYYNAGLYSNNGIVTYSTAVIPALGLIFLSDGRLAKRITDFFYQVL